MDIPLITPDLDKDRERGGGERGNQTGFRLKETFMRQSLPFQAALAKSPSGGLGKWAEFLMEGKRGSTPHEVESGKEILILPLDHRLRDRARKTKRISERWKGVL